MDQAKKSKRKDHILLSPTLNESRKIEYSVHRVLPRMVTDLTPVFPGTDISDVLIIPTFQECNCDLVAFGPEPDAEKDRLLENFVEWAKSICKAIHELVLCLLTLSWILISANCLFVSLNTDVYWELGPPIRSQGYWADLTDPCSGCPVFGVSNNNAALIYFVPLWKSCVGSTFQV